MVKCLIWRINGRNVVPHVRTGVNLKAKWGESSGKQGANQVSMVNNTVDVSKGNQIDLHHSSSITF